MWIDGGEGWKDAALLLLAFVAVMSVALAVANLISRRVLAEDEATAEEREEVICYLNVRRLCEKCNRWFVPRPDDARICHRCFAASLVKVRRDQQAGG